MDEYNYAILISPEDQVIGTVKMEKGSCNEMTMVNKCLDDGIKIYKLSEQEYINLEIW